MKEKSPVHKPSLAWWKKYSDGKFIYSKQRNSVTPKNKIKIVLSSLNTKCKMCNERIILMINYEYIVLYFLEYIIINFLSKAAILGKCYHLAVLNILWYG